MSFEQKDDSGALFKNDKGDNPNRPDYTGNGMVKGQEVRIAAWIKKSAKGTAYMSLAFSDPKPKDQPVADRGQSFHDDDIPNFQTPPSGDVPF